MLEVMIVHRSRNGIVLPLARTANREIVRAAVAQVRKELERLKFDDPEMQALAEAERLHFEHTMRRYGYE